MALDKVGKDSETTNVQPLLVTDEQTQPRHHTVALSKYKLCPIPAFLSFSCRSPPQDSALCVADLRIRSPPLKHTIPSHATLDNRQSSGFLFPQTSWVTRPTDSTLNQPYDRSIYTPKHNLIHPLWTWWPAISHRPSMSRNGTVNPHGSCPAGQNLWYGRVEPVWDEQVLTKYYRWW